MKKTKSIDLSCFVFTVISIPLIYEQNMNEKKLLCKKSWKIPYILEEYVQIEEIYTDKGMIL